ncbi:hypothetical protein GUJ93_ZPchr0002g25392 [Zizania palustris]|uniref:Uncharacterized protein n=1 Tax=Zizania palustris TaxID=103762 RepID=A0A8J5S2T5_ZIZPA|nr:hypothetical protein GUJ93_ZPchr0002g25392 [Zizania palustris]
MSAMEAMNGEDIPVIDLDELTGTDDFLFGFPARVLQRRLQATLRGDGSRTPSELELALTEHHGKYMATLVKRMVHGVA